MIRRILAAGVVALAASVSLVPSSVAGAATQSATISGAFQELAPDNFVAVNPTPPFVYVGLDVHPIAFEGGLVGTAASTEHTAAGPTGTFETHNYEAFDNVTVTGDDGTVIGSGSLLINFNAQGVFTFDSAGNFTGGSFHGVWQIVSAGGGLTGLQGSGTVVGVPGSTTGFGTYTGSVHR